MNDYIKREDAVEKIKADCDRFDHIPKRVVDFFTLGMESVPSADVVEVRHGKWSHDYIKDGMEYSDWFNLHCSICGQMQFSTFGKWNYCPHCGAKMDEEEQENE